MHSVRDHRYGHTWEHGGLQNATFRRGTAARRTAICVRQGQQASYDNEHLFQHIQFQLVFVIFWKKSENLLFESVYMLILIVLLEKDKKI
jgi:hypothetical protein